MLPSTGNNHEMLLVAFLSVLGTVAAKDPFARLFDALHISDREEYEDKTDVKELFELSQAANMLFRALLDECMGVQQMQSEETDITTDAARAAAGESAEQGD